MKRGMLLAILAGVGMVTSSLTQWLLYAALGVGRMTDAVIASITVPQIFMTMVMGPMSNVLVPMLSDLEPARHRALASTLALQTTVWGSAVVALLFVTAPSWVPLTLPGFEPEALELVVELTRIQLIGLVIALPQGVVLSSAVALNRFLAIELAQTLLMVAIAALMFPVLSVSGVHGAAWLFSARTALRTALILPFGFVRPTLRWSSGVEGRVLRLTIPLALSGSLRSTEGMVNQFLVSMAPPGALSLFNLAKTLYTAAFAVLNKAALTPAFPGMGRLAKAGEFGRMVRQVRRTGALACGLVLLGWIFVAIAGEPTLRVLIGHGGITNENVHELTLILLALGGMPLGMAWNQPVTFGVYSLEKTTVLSTVVGITFLVGIALKFYGFKVAGVVGLATGTSAYNLVLALAATAVLHALVKKAQAARIARAA